MAPQLTHSLPSEKSSNMSTGWEVMWSISSLVKARNLLWENLGTKGRSPSIARSAVDHPDRLLLLTLTPAPGDRLRGLSWERDMELPGILDPGGPLLVMRKGRELGSGHQQPGFLSLSDRKSVV